MVVLMLWCHARFSGTIPHCDASRFRNYVRLLPVEVCGHYPVILLGIRMCLCRIDATLGLWFICDHGLVLGTF